MLPLFLNLLCPIPIQAHLHMVQHVADWVAAFPRGQHSPPHPLKFSYTPLHLPLSFRPLRARELGQSSSSSQKAIPTSYKLSLCTDFRENPCIYVYYIYIYTLRIPTHIS